MDFYMESGFICITRRRFYRFFDYIYTVWEDIGIVRSDIYIS
ncbi:hypothetical protein [Mesobacillus campisalis]|nr:hypothetical protein [Mesobacillus campisalis]